MNRKLFGTVVIIVIMLSTFLISCDCTPRYTVLYTMHSGNSVKKASQVVEAESAFQAVAKVQQSCWVSCDSITVKHISRNSR